MSNKEYVPEEERKELTQKDRVELDKPLNKWIVVKDACYSGGGYYRCPVCGYEYSWGAFFELDEYSYCPKCGALLNGKTEASDYISRQAAIESLKICELGEEVSIIEIIPSADVVEVVRCRDCIKHEYCRTSNTWAVTPNDDWFCADGERRTDGEILY